MNENAPPEVESTETRSEGSGEKRFPIVAIGASAGGLEALRTFFTAMPVDKGIGFVVILHLAPSHKSNLAQILAAVTRMPVAQAQDGDIVHPNHVYVIPPNKYLSIGEGRLRLEPSVARPAIPLPIDHFFRALAEDQAEQAIAIVVTGGDGDGSHGLKEIKAAGGMVMAQTPETAQHPGMPRHAIATGLTDFVLPIEAMPAALIDYIEHAALANARKDGGTAAKEAAASAIEADAKLAEILEFLRLFGGHDFRCYKKAMLLRRVRHRMGLITIGSLADYVTHLKKTAQELQDLTQDLLINVTDFFREPESWKALERDIIPLLMPEENTDAGLRIWVPGCSTGEEAYTLGMLLLERLDKSPHGGKIDIFATDIDREALEKGRLGSYPESIATVLSAPRLQRFFTRAGQRYQIKRELRDMVVFAPQNLISDPPFSKLDLISCHNLLIYLEPEQQEKMIELFHFALNPGGYLFLGKSETVGRHQSRFETVSKKWRIFRCIGPRYQLRMNFPGAQGRAPALAIGSSRRRRDPSYDNLLRDELLARHAPTAVLVNRDDRVLYFHGRTDDYLVQPGGAPTGDLLTMARDGLRLKLRAALRSAVKEEAVTRVTVDMSTADGTSRVEITVTPLREPNLAAGLLLVTFQAQPKAAGGGGAPGADSPPASSDGALEESAAIRQLEQELATTQQELHYVIEDLETANEELKVGNEEALSMNEELQSTNEELETSKEELQSVNEELTTVNNELEQKLGQLNTANNDILNLLVGTNIATLFLDRDFRIKRFTPALSRLFKVISTDVDRPIADIANHFADGDLLHCAGVVLDQLTPHEREIESDDGLVYLRRILPYRTGDNRIEGVVVTFTDVTEVQRAAARTRRLVAIVTDSNDAITAFDFDGRILAWNHGAERTYGYREAEALAMNFAVLLAPGGRPEFDDIVRRIRNNEVPRSYDTKRLTKDGRLLDIWATLSVLRGADGIPTAVATTERDNTERRGIERSLRSRAKQLVEDSHRKDEFLAMLAHELRNPLAPIRNAVETLRRSVSEEPTLTVARDIIDRQVIHLSRLIDDLLDAARITQGHIVLRRKPMVLRALIERAIEMNRPFIDMKQQRLSVDLPAQPIWLTGDFTRLTQVVGNLLNNAAKYTDEGGDIHISGEVDGAEVVLRVRDTGIGIAAELLPKMFDLFTQGERALARSEGGLGIGLTLVRQLVELHGGSVTASSGGPGQGSTFELRLPLVEAEAAAKETTAAADEAVTFAPARPRRVLLVDDNIDTVESMAAILDMEGHDVRTATNGRTAIDLAESFRPHAVMLDIGLPVMDGYEVAKRLRTIPHMEKALLLAVTGYDKPEDRRLSREAGFDHHLVKPVDPAAILALLAAGRES